MTEHSGQKMEFGVPNPAWLDLFVEIPQLLPFLNG